MTTSRRRLHLCAAGLAVLAATAPLAACAGPAPQLLAAPGARPGTRCGTLTLAVKPWVGYTANAAVVSYLARTELGCTVTVKAEPEADSWKHLAAGRVDAILENWGHDDLKKRYIDAEKVAVEDGPTTDEGVIGWYVPPWMADEYPDITDRHNLVKYADLFRTAETGAKGQLLDGDPTYVTNDAAPVRNLGLDYTVVYAGSEQTLIAAFRAAQKNHQPLLGYFYSPQWLLSVIPLVHVALPPYTPGCDAGPRTVACEYQPEDLDKIANARFAASDSPAAELIKNFRWSGAHQNQVARDITENGLTADQAAKKWLDGHAPVWQAWLPAKKAG